VPAGDLTSEDFVDSISSLGKDLLKNINKLKSFWLSRRKAQEDLQGFER